MSNQPENHTFQAEVSQLLDIVINSLYTDKEIFVRELISNASDALEKLRLKQLTGGEIHDADLPLEINITVDEEAKTITLSDYGIGMTREELNENLGTIAHSGTKSFLNALKENQDQSADVIGQFGVGFYSAFMVADEVEVLTRSWQQEGESLLWKSDGKTGYTVEEVADPSTVKRGAQLIIHLKEEHADFAKSERLKGIIERYSNFVGFPVNLDGERVNSVEALWLKSKSEISEEEYATFYQFIAHAHESPRHTMHFSADAPLAINALLFVPANNTERFGFGQMEAGVSLYCRKVMIDDKPTGLLPEWLRFIRGVIDCEDIPLNISRESMQDSALVQKLNQVITKRFLKFLAKLAKDDEAAYQTFFTDFGRFLKEGLVSSYEHQESLAGLLRFESSLIGGEEESTDKEGEADSEKASVLKATSLDDYISRAKEDQDEIYYLVANSRGTIENGPYLEAFKERNLEVAYFTDAVDDYVLETLSEYKGKKLVAADRAEIDLDDVATEGTALPAAELESLLGWMGKSLGEKVEKVEAGQRLVSHALVALAPKESPNAQMRAMMQAMGEDAPKIKATLEINPRHGLMHKLNALHAEKPEAAEKIASQLADNALLAAGLCENPVTIAASMNTLIEDLL